MKLARIISIIFITSSLCYSQNNQWITFLGQNNSIDAVAIQGENLWVATTTYLARRNTLSGAGEQYPKSRSGLPYNSISRIVPDIEGDLWVGTHDGGLEQFDGKTWTVYNTSNSGLPSNSIYAIATDQLGNEWIGTPLGLVKYDKKSWTVYNKTNSGMPHNVVYSIAIDAHGNKWVGTPSGLLKYDDKTWVVYRFTENSIYSVVIDQLGNKWINTGSNGIIKFDDRSWTVYNSSNSGLPTNDVNSIFIDSKNNK